MKPNQWILCGGLLAALSVAAGAFGAHGLEGRLKAGGQLSETEVNHRLDIHEKAARYQMYHSLALIAVGLMTWRAARPALAVAGWAFLAGTIVFSGCLYAIVLGGPLWLGAVVPIGGVAFLVGWIALAVSAWQTPG
ncbi:MAG TPA: DUF423 domain-containing protein [Pirellulales bacterium]